MRGRARELLSPLSTTMLPCSTTVKQRSLLPGYPYVLRQFVLSAGFVMRQRALHPIGQAALGLLSPWASLLST